MRFLVCLEHASSGPNIPLPSIVPKAETMEVDQQENVDDLFSPNSPQNEEGKEGKDDGQEVEEVEEPHENENEREANVEAPLGLINCCAVLVFFMCCYTF